MKKILGILAGAALVSAGPAHATNGMRMIGFGPTQNAMGGAGVAAPLDSATVVSNPAGLADLAQRFDLAAQAFAPDVKYKMVTPGPTMSGSSDRPTDLLPTLGGVFRLQDQLTLGFAALGTAGMGVDYKADPGGDPLLSSYLNARVAPAAAYRVNDRLAVGLALNLMYAQMEFQYQGSPKFSASSFGYGATVGVSFKASDLVTLGAAYETRSFFQDFEDTIGGTKQALAFDQPMVATLGVALRPAKGLLLAIDGQWINWSDVMGKDLPKFTKPAGAGNFDMRWSDQLVAKIGAEYQLPSVQALRLRAGYNYGATPLEKANYSANTMFPAIAEHHFTVGGGYAAGKVDVNLAFVYSPEATIKAGPVAGGFDSFESSMSQLAFELGASYRF
jgi:long-chain fatty acid transport protein